MADSHFCGLYGSGVETLLHAVRDCLVARNVWVKFVPQTTWRIWKRRNSSLFNGEFGEVSIEVAGIIAFAKLVTLANNRSNQQNDPTRSFNRWQSPPNNWCKLNMDGSRHLITGQASAGGLFWDRRGKSVTGYDQNIGVCFTLDSELWEIMDGLGIAWKRGVKQLLVESDCLVAVNMLNGQIDETEENMVVDSMATLGRNVSLGLKIYDVPRDD
ncbi:hypothetical protein Goari_003365 [Gossypium aridum]|uniref:RNase H type-1 domain-containing protein n=1 Tax=Gossypium aridum TaxID=34290 RepID=A0A7J8YBR0_GOSAI|nr:hypothetical protein [Gossypium aridum]